MFAFLAPSLEWLISKIGISTMLTHLMPILKNIVSDTTNTFDNNAYMAIEGILIETKLIDNPDGRSGIQESVKGFVNLLSDVAKLTTNEYDDKAIDFAKGILTVTGLYK